METELNCGNRRKRNESARRGCFTARSPACGQRKRRRCCNPSVNELRPSASSFQRRLFVTYLVKLPRLQLPARNNFWFARYSGVTMIEPAALFFRPLTTCVICLGMQRRMCSRDFLAADRSGSRPLTPGYPPPPLARLRGKTRSTWPDLWLYRALGRQRRAAPLPDPC
jgi:hypothetical protein